MGLYGSDQMVAIRLAREAGGAENVLMAWENRHPVEQGDSGGRAGHKEPGGERPLPL